ncbi:hypothetical protein FOL47_008017 [Perkinsus chesapeaki]|uniref:Alpha/beta hydrolase fold-3 domain-containing protein n=1 Tax=Perkinsus chesapeaki TaxID=330153 RepID=A0A7J6LHK8_PERCH|nr:hypothetical protein FOL47_008017 [Perkinsus chesapeaki]
MHSPSAPPNSSDINAAEEGTGQFAFNVSGPPQEGPNWNDLNYPKGTKLFHYKPHDDLPINVAHRCNLLHANFLLAVAVLLLNIVDTIIVILAYQSPLVTLLYTFLNLVIFGSATFVVFYTGYLALAMRSRRQLLYHKIAAAIMFVIGLYFMLAGGGAINGFLKGLTYNVRGYWWFAVVVESLMWFGYLCFLCYNMYLMIRFCPVSVIISTNVWVWFYLGLKWIRIAFTLLWARLTRRRLRPEERLALFTKPPEEFDIEWKRRSRLIGSYMRLRAAVTEAYDSVLARAAFPGLKTKTMPRTGDLPERLWVRLEERYELPVSQYVVLYYIHGGGYCFLNGVSTHRHFVARMIEALQRELRDGGMVGVKVVGLIVNYSLAPAAILPTQLLEAVNVYRYILSQDKYPVEANRIVLAGDGAGGSLCLGVLKCLQLNHFASHLPHPGCCITMSPIVNLRGGLGRRVLDMSRDALSNAALWHAASCALYGRPSKPRERMDGRDRPGEMSNHVQKSGNFADKEWSSVRAQSPSGHPEENPLFSCACGDLSPTAFGNVPILVQAGGSESMAEEIAAFSESASGSVMLEMYENMFHCFQMHSSLSHSQLALRHMGRFVSDVFGAPQRIPIGRSYSEGMWPMNHSISIDLTGRSAEWSIPFLTPEGTELFKAFWGVSFRAWYLMVKHLIGAVVQLCWMACTGKPIKPEDVITRLIQMPDEFNEESSYDGEYLPEVMRVVEALGKVLKPAVVRLRHPKVHTEMVPATKGCNRGIWVWSSEGPVDDKEHVVLYFIHGGGYCFFDGVTSHLELATNMMETLQKKLRSDGWENVAVVAYIIEYSLAPEKIFPTQLQEVVNGYKFLLSQTRFPVKSDRIVLGGDSAGGGIELGFLKCLAGNYFCKDLPSPSSCLALNPFVDFGYSVARKSYDTSHDLLSNIMLWYCACVLYGRPSHPGERLDTMNHPLESDSYVQKAGRFNDKEWVRVREMAPGHRMDKHPLFSVIDGDLNPEAFANVPILVQAGSVEALHGDISRFADKARHSVCFEVYQDMFHVFPVFSKFVPLGQIAVNRWANFASKALKGEKLPIGKSYAVSEKRVESL